MEACLPRPEKCPREFKEEVHYLRGGPNVLSGQTFQFEIENPEPFPGDSWKYKTRGTTFNKPTTKSMIETTRIPRPTFNNSPIPNKPQIEDFVFLLLGLLINHLSEF